MKVVSVQFVTHLPVPGPVYLQLQGVRQLLPMVREANTWALSVDLPEGVYAYRFVVSNLVTINDCRRSTQRVTNKELWSVLQVTSAGPVWRERVLPVLAGLELCQGISDSGLPLVVIDSMRPSELPFVLWAEISHLYEDAFIQVFLLKPNGELAFGGEFLLDTIRTSADYQFRFWISINLEADAIMPGMWTCLVRVEGGSVSQRNIRVLMESTTSTGRAS